MSRWFFLSYAHENCDKYLEKFCRDLNDTIRDLTAPRDGEEGFLDTNSIELGAQWPGTLTTALQNCRAFVAIYSPAYFTKESCGKEWQAFRSRQAEYAAGLPLHSSRPSLILPVLWVPEARLPYALPDAASEVQYKHGDFGKTYATEGLKQLMRLSRYRDHYRTFLVRFAEKLIQASSEHCLPPLFEPESFERIESAFKQVASVGKPAAALVNRGPRESRFLFVAGCRAELQSIRQKLEPYGEVGGYDWQPFLPDFTDEVGIIAQEVASKENLHYQVVPFDDDIIKRIDEAELNNKIVAIIIDTWTLCLPRYNDFMSEYDRRNFVNCVVLILWNRRDHETETNRSILVDKMWGTFSNHAVKPDPNCFRDSVSSPDELKRELSFALNRARARISAKAAVVRRAESELSFEKPPAITGVRRASV